MYWEDRINFFTLKVLEACSETYLQSICPLMEILDKIAATTIATITENTSSNIRSRMENVISKVVAKSVFLNESINLEQMVESIHSNLKDDELEIYSEQVFDPKVWNTSRGAHSRSLIVFNYYVLFANDKSIKGKLFPEGHNYYKELSDEEFYFIDISRPLPEGEIILNLNQIQDYGTFLFHVLNGANNIKDEAFNFFIMNTVMLYLDFENITTLSPIEIFKIYDNSGESPHCLKNRAFRNITSSADICSNDSTLECQEYCNVVKILSTNGEKLHKFMDVFFPDASSNNDSNPYHLVPFCKTSNGQLISDCATKVVTDQGICYQVSRLDSDKYIEQNDFDGTFDIVFDFGNQLGIDEGFWSSKLGLIPQNFKFTIFMAPFQSLAFNTQKKEVISLSTRQSGAYTSTFSTLSVTSQCLSTIETTKKFR